MTPSTNKCCDDCSCAGSGNKYCTGICPCHKPTEPSVCEFDLTRDCTGCTDERSEGTHQGCTKQHGHVGCASAKPPVEPPVPQESWEERFRKMASAGEFHFGSIPVLSRIIDFIRTVVDEVGRIKYDEGYEKAMREMRTSESR